MTTTRRTRLLAPIFVRLPISTVVSEAGEPTSFYSNCSPISCVLFRRANTIKYPFLALRPSLLLDSFDRSISSSVLFSFRLLSFFVSRFVRFFYTNICLLDWSRESRLIKTFGHQIVDEPAELSSLISRLLSAIPRCLVYT